MPSQNQTRSVVASLYTVVRPQNRDSAFGVVRILPSGTGKALAYLTDGWEVVDKASFDYEDHIYESGVPVGRTGEIAFASGQH
jgi:hypothetical protein